MYTGGSKVLAPQRRSDLTELRLSISVQDILRVPKSLQRLQHQKSLKHISKRQTVSGAEPSVVTAVNRDGAQELVGRTRELFETKRSIFGHAVSTNRAHEIDVQISQETMGNHENP